MVDRQKKKTKFDSYCLLTNKNETFFYTTKNKKMRQTILTFAFSKIFIQQVWKIFFFFDTAAGAGVDAAKTALQKVIHKPFEVTE